jgi:large subunit ribosomal protein LP0
MVRRALRSDMSDNPQYERLMQAVKGNIGFVFTKGDMRQIRDKILGNRVKAPAKAGAIAPIDVTVAAGNTGMEPGKTSFFQALGVPTKIARGTIEIINDVHLIKAGHKVGASEASLLNMLNISPFTYGMTVQSVYDSGTIFPASVLDIKPESFLEHLSSGIKTVAAISLTLGYMNKASTPYIEAGTSNLMSLGARKVAALSFAINYPTLASLPHVFIKGYKNLLALSLESEYKIPAAAKVRLVGWISKRVFWRVQTDRFVCILSLLVT